MSAVLGTHTHVQTNDAQKLPNDLLFISDVGMTGPENSAIGANFEEVYEKYFDDIFLTQNQINEIINERNKIIEPVLNGEFAITCIINAASTFGFSKTPFSIILFEPSKISSAG